jgi:hypothetical protein
MGPSKLAKSNAEQVARGADRRESRHCLTMINGRCAQTAAIRQRRGALAKSTRRRVREFQISSRPWENSCLSRRFGGVA